MNGADAFDEAAKDPRISQPDFQLAFSEQDIEGHRLHTVYVGVHLPQDGARRHHRRQKRHSKNNADKTRDSNRPKTPPSQRVQFILGEEFDTDQETHPLFTEMGELVKEGSDVQWMETARWIKFEEDVEEGSNRWSKPHVATLSLHSLFELRLLLLQGHIFLDLDTDRLDVISDKIGDVLMKDSKNTFTVEMKAKLKHLLMRPHRHLHELKGKITSPAVFRMSLPTDELRTRDMSDLQHARPSSTNLLHATASSSGLSGGRSSTINLSASKTDQRGYLAVPSSAPPVDGQSDNNKRAENNNNENGRFLSVPEDDTILGSRLSVESTYELNIRSNTPFMRKVPFGAEASNVLVGEVDFIEENIMAFIRLKEGVIIGDLTEIAIPTRFIIIILVPEGSNRDYRELGRAISTLMSDEVFTEVAYRARSLEHILAGVDEFLDAVTVLPPAEWDPSIRIEPPAIIPSQEVRKRPPDVIKEEVDLEEEERRQREESGLVPSGRLFGGLINDVKRKKVWFVSDFTDAASPQCFATWIFLYFACLAPIITFGGLLSEATGKNMGAIESLVSGFVCGVGFGLLSGQPLNILGSTGPVLVFETIVYEFCVDVGWDFLTFRYWIGTWIALILLLLVALDSSYLVCYITRFTEENFASLIALIFIYKAFEYILMLGYTFPVNPRDPYDCVCTPPAGSNDTLLDWAKYTKKQCQSHGGLLVGEDCDMEPSDNVILMTVILFLGTFILSTTLRNFRNALFFPSSVRQFISDFSVVTAIFGMSFLDYWANVPTPKLEVPAEFKPTLHSRGWVIPPFTENTPAWSSLFALVPALLGTILIFMDQQITAVIINRKENKLRKGCGYHLDLFVLALLIEICSFMGLPWFVASTVVSINHIDSLKMESECAAPGEKPHFLGVREQRVTHILIALTTGGSVMLIPLLSHIPMPVLYGVFLYMGIASLKGLQLYDRVLIMFMPDKYQPDFMFLRQVPVKRVHLFTLIQLTCLILLWVVKSIPQTSILFPLMLVVMVGIRKLLDNVFTRRELKILDDLMPRSKKSSQNLDDEDGSTTMDNTYSRSYNGNTSRNIANMPLANGCVMQIPINITDESNRTKIWKQASHDKSQSIDPDEGRDTHLIIPTTLKARRISGGNYQIRHVIRSKQNTGTEVRTTESSKCCQKLPFESFI